MSTYSSIQGEITADGAAVLSLAMSTSWLWLDPRALDEEDIEIAHREDGGSVWQLSGQFRNLCRYLTVDLAEAAELGELTCLVVSECQDGCHTREVLRVRGGQVLVGSSECFNAPVELRAGRIQSFELSLGEITGMGTQMRFMVEEGDVLETLLPQEIPAALECACGGWDHDLDEPVCGTRG